MAFIELSEDEVDLLSESEKRQYKKEQMLYRERVAFVEKLEQIENAGFQYQKPKMERIKPVCRIDIPKYKAICVTPVSLPMNLMRQKDFRDSVHARLSYDGKIKTRNSRKYKVTDVTIVKTATPTYAVSHYVKRKYELSNVLAAKRKIEMPSLKLEPFGNIKITNMPGKKKTAVPSISFIYVRRPVSVTPVKAKLPKIIKYAGVHAVKIKNIPMIFINKKAMEKYSYSQKNENAFFNVREKAASAKITIQQVEFIPQMFKIQDLSKNRVCRIDTSEVSERMERTAVGRINMEHCLVVTPTVPSFGKYAHPICEVTVPQNGKVLIPTLKDYEAPILNTTVENIPQFLNVSTPVFHHFQLATMDGVKGVKPQKVRQPNHSIGDVACSVRIEVPTFSMHIPDYTEDDVNNVLERILNVIQGA